MSDKDQELTPQTEDEDEGADVEAHSWAGGDTAREGHAGGDTERESHAGGDS